MKNLFLAILYLALAILSPAQKRKSTRRNTTAAVSSHGPLYRLLLWLYLKGMPEMDVTDEPDDTLPVYPLY